MNLFLKHYKIKLTALSPIFIGSGQEISKCEYVFVNNVVYVIDPHKLMKVIAEKGLTPAYINYMRSGGKNQKTLQLWLKQNGIKDYRSISAYELTGINNIKDTRGLKGIKTFMKDAYNHPYIPGSSLKGMLRSVILWNEAYDHGKEEKVEKTADDAAAAARNLNGRDLKKKLAKHSDKLEDMFFTEKIDNAVVSNMRGLSISDSKPLELSDLTLCEKVDISESGIEKRPNIMRECIKPGVCVEFDMTIDEDKFRYSADDIRQKIKNYSFYYGDIVTYAFGDNEQEDNALFLGGGAGYFSKTVTYGLFDDIKAVEFARNYLKKTTPRNHHHENDYNISPHMQKCTVYNGKIREMGKCSIEIESMM